MSNVTASAPSQDGHQDVAAHLPACFTSLGPWSAWLKDQGGLALMYHKLGPRPPRVRLKGLYVSQDLFGRQMSELSRAGYQSAGFGDPGGRGSPPAQRVVLTFDDGFENVLRHGLEPLRRARFRAIQFLVADRIGQTNDWEQREGEVPERLMDTEQVREWLAAGHDIGAHTCTHPRLSQIPLAAAVEEIRGSKAKLEDRFGRPVQHFCYPYGDLNPAVRDAVEAAGFLTACTTRRGANRMTGDPFLLRRLPARYASRNWRNLRLALQRWLTLGRD